MQAIGSIGNYCAIDFGIRFIINGKTGDDNNTVLIPVGTGRVFYDGDYISGISSTFRLAAPLLTSFSGGTVNGVKK